MCSVDRDHKGPKLTIHYCVQEPSPYQHLCGQLSWHCIFFGTFPHGYCSPLNFYIYAAWILTVQCVLERTNLIHTRPAVWLSFLPSDDPLTHGLYLMTRQAWLAAKQQFDLWIDQREWHPIVFCSFIYLAARLVSCLRISTEGLTRPIISQH